MRLWSADAVASLPVDGSRRKEGKVLRFPYERERYGGSLSGGQCLSGVGR
jgi:hypothetical protein